MINNLALAAMILISVSIIGVILMQKKGSGVGSVFGGGSESYRSKRGAEKFLYYITIGLGVLFALIPFSLLFLS